MTRLVARLLLLALVLALVVPAAHGAEDPRVIKVDVSRYGWNGDPNLIITVEEGELVELLFTYGDGDLAVDNPHVMRIEGLNLESGDLSLTNPTTAIRFRPEKTGTYALKCVITCEGHDLLTSGRVRVVAAGGAAAGVEPQATSVRVTTSPPPVPGGQAEVRARATTGAGVPLEGVVVEFALRTTFLISGWMELGQARTGADGEAVFRFTPTAGGDQTVRARYAGSGRYLGAERSSAITVPPVPLPHRAEGGGLIPGLGFWLLGVVVGGVWLTYLLILYQLRLVSLDR